MKYCSYGVCPQCGHYDHALGKTAEEAQQNLMNGHGKQHVFRGVVKTYIVQGDEEYKLTRADRQPRR